MTKLKKLRCDKTQKKKKCVKTKILRKLQHLAPSTLSLGDSFSTLPLGFSTVAFKVSAVNSLCLLDSLVVRLSFLFGKPFKAHKSVSLLIH